MLRAASTRLRVATFTSVVVACAGSARVASQSASSLHVPNYMSEAPVGAGCGADRADVPDTLVSVVDVLIDSASNEALNELRLALSFAPKSEPGLSRPNISAGILYPVEDRSVPREVFAGCPWLQGVTLRVNATRVRRAALSVDATGPVRIAVRGMSGVLLTAPVLAVPGSVPYTIQWVRGDALPNERCS
jgi:hypothetical protein